MPTRYYEATMYAEDGVTPDLVVTSVPGADCYLAAPPSGDGQSLDLLTSDVDIGGYSVSILDPGFAVLTPKLADASGRWAGAGRAFVVRSGTDGVTFPDTFVPGFVNRLKLVNPIRADLTIGEVRRGEDDRRIWSRVSAAWPYSMALLGGPVRGAATAPALHPFRSRDYGPVTFRVGSVTAHADGPIVGLDFVRGFLQFAPGDFDYFTGYATPEGQRLFAAAQRYAVPMTPARYASLGIYHWFPDLRAEVRAPAAAGGALVGRVDVVSTPLALVASSIYTDVRTTPRILGRDARRIWLRWVDHDYAPGDPLYLPTLPSVGDLLDVVLYAETVAADNPLYVAGHPCDLVAALYDEAGIAYDAASHLATKEAVGALVSVAKRVTAATTLGAGRRELQALFGFAVRGGPGGVRVFFPTRVRSAAASVQTNTAADLRGPPPEVFTLDERTVVNSVRVVTTRYRFAGDPGVESGTGEGARDDIVPGPLERVYDPAPGTALPYPAKEVRLEFDGQVTTVPGPFFVSYDLYANEPHPYYEAIAREIFDRFGRGAPETALDCLPSVTAQVGDIVTLDLPWHPNGAARGGLRDVQVVQRTETPSGPAVRVVDAGLAAQPATAPTFTVAASADDPEHIAAVALTNGPALVAQGSTVRLEYAVVAAGGAAPSGSGAPLAVLDPAVTTAARTPPTDAGARVWVRARSEQTDRRPGPWTAWASAALTALAPPTSLTTAAVAGDDSLRDLSWTLGSAALPVRVLARATSGPLTDATLRPVATLPAGSTRYRLSALEVSTGYQVAVEHVDRAPFAGASTRATATFTTGATVPTLAAPGDPVLTSDGAGTVRVTVQPTEVPSTTVIELADETAVGSGVAGTYSGVLRAVSAPDSFVEYVAADVPNTGRRLFARAKHERAGVTDSVYTAERSADPWTVSAPPLDTPTLAAPTIGGSRAGGGVTITITFDPSNPPGTLAHVERDDHLGGGYVLATTSGPVAGPTYGELSAPGTDYRAFAVRAGYVQSAYSNVVTP